MVNGLPCYKDRHPLLLEHSMTFLRFIMIMRDAFDSIYEPLMIHILSIISAEKNSQIHLTNQVWNILSAWVMGCVML